jgi:undecaprenyl-diphosphatase
MMSLWQAVLFGALQGVTELFPISSLGHSVVLPRLLHWNIDQTDPNFLIFLVATHAATALVLFFYFWKDWQKIFVGLVSSLKDREIRDTNVYGKLGWLLVVGTIPAGILGLLFEDVLKHLFASPQIVAFVLIVNGIMLWLADQLARKRSKVTESGSDERIAKLSWMDSIKVGLFQCIALLPGFSRTGATLTGSLLTGLSYEDSARFAFLLATPIIVAAAVLKLPELMTQTGSTALLPTLVGALAAGICAYFSVKYLLKYFETKTLRPFAIYCLIAGIVLSLLFFL